MFLKKGDPYLLIVGMTAVKMGDRFLQVGCAHGGRLAAVAGKVGLSGRAVVVAPDEPSAARARKAAEDAGVLVEVEVAAPTQLPLADDEFDLAVVDDTAGLFGTMRPEGRVAATRELDASPARRRPRAGRRRACRAAAFGAVLSRMQSGPPFVASGDATKALEADGFKSVRTLAEREGLVFVEGISRGRQALRTEPGPASPRRVASAFSVRLAPGTRCPDRSTAGEALFRLDSEVSR